MKDDPFKAQKAVTLIGQNQNKINFCSALEIKYG
jgi:hypothetical protein|tara:strand:+ start:163 stop:264 length:102 start_codon:yes stop_codon:yes gene_type:complete